MQTNPESAAVEAVALEYVPGRLDETAPARIWLQVDVMADNDDRGDEFPGLDHVTWQDESLGGLEVQYVRADLHQSALDALRGEVAALREADQSMQDELGRQCARRRDAELRADAAERRVKELEAAAEPFVRFSSGERYIDLRMPTSAIERMRRLLRKDDALTKESP